MSCTEAQAVVIGGGFFGCSVASYIRRRMKSVVLIEQEPALFRHASYANQARIHNGYHYPRSLQTAYRSRVNFQSFVKDFPECVVSGFTHLYGIARHRSQVNARQFTRFCSLIDAPCKPARDEYARLFDARLIESVFEVQEPAFDSEVLGKSLGRRLIAAGVEVSVGKRVERIESLGSEHRVFLSGGDEIATSYVFNCTYAGIRSIPGFEAHCRTPVKHEIAEIALIEPPEELGRLGVTIMCGPFFSTMPFPPRGLHSLSHVRYTPHGSWCDPAGQSRNAYEVLKGYSRSKSRHMLEDAQRYLPLLGKARIVDSMFEIKTLLMRNEIDDGRPILMERSGVSRNIYSILGGKIDNIYDVIQRLSADGL